MALASLYKKLSDSVTGVERAANAIAVWSHVKDFAAELNFIHCSALDSDRVRTGLTNAILYSDSPQEIRTTIDREGLNVDHPVSAYSREASGPFLISDVRRDERFKGRRWAELLSDPLKAGDAVVMNVHSRHGLNGCMIFGGHDFKDSPLTRSSLLVMAHAAFDRIDMLSKGVDTTNDLQLSERELDCLQLLARGLSDEEIAPMLGISRRTVRYHVDHAKQKLGVSSRVHAVAAAVNRGLVSL